MDGGIGAGFTPVSQLGRDFANQAVRFHILQGRTPQGWGSELPKLLPGIAGFLEKPGSGPHPGLPGGLLGQSFIHFFIHSPNTQ